MKAGLMILGITTFLVVNTYYDGKYTKMLSINQKYFKMAMFAFVGFSMYLLIKKNPKGSKSMLQHANALIRYMPVDRETADLISPIFDFTNAKNSMDSMAQSYTAYNDDTPQHKRMLNSGGNTTTRSVSETKKKYVAAQQGWKCNNCGTQLNHTFEVDHKVDLRYGGTNHVSNLVALCRNCHGEKTLQNKLE
jgi:hypothetical protein|tara:strand:- start:586 stop:1161 length:576 start_codon:yes stop_codon:yes gene_type:complete